MKIPEIEAKALWGLRDTEWVLEVEEMERNAVIANRVRMKTEREMKIVIRRMVRR